MVGSFLRLNVGFRMLEYLGVALVGDRVALADHPGGQILGIGAPYGDHPTVAARVTRITGDGPLADPLGES